MRERVIYPMDFRGLQMSRDHTPGAKGRLKGSYVSRELQLTISVIVIMALLGGIVLQALSGSILKRYDIGTPYIGFILIVGYIFLVAVISIFFAHRFVGPFRRIEYEMKLIASGELSRRLSVRKGDDLHVRHFVARVNDFVGSFEEMSREYNALYSLIDRKLSMIDEEISTENPDCEAIKRDIKELKERIHRMRERW